MEHELRADYGTVHCDTWDEGLDPFCAGENPPSFCGMPCCYVSEECNAPDKGKSTIFEDSDLLYSYATCGNSSNFNDFVAPEPKDCEPILCEDGDLTCGED